MLRFVIHLVQLGAFGALTAIAVARWRRRRGSGAGWLALSFGTLGMVLLVRGILLLAGSHGEAAWCRRLLVIGFVLFPFCLYRFTTAFRGAPSFSSGLISSSTVGISILTLVVPEFPTPGVPWTRSVLLFAAHLTIHWTLVAATAAVRLWRSGRGQPTVARRRVRTLALAAGMLNLALLIIVANENRDAGTAVQIGRLVGLLGTTLFVAGFSPPKLLRALWRRREVAAFRRAEADLLAADTAQQVADVVLPHAAGLVGGRGAALVDGAGMPIALHCLERQEFWRLAARLPERREGSGPGKAVISDHLVAIPLRAGWLVVVTTEAAPLFGIGEVELLSTLAHFAGLALDRSDLFDRERTNALMLAEREAQLAEAQRTAMLGSYVWDLETDEVTWSDEMYRVLGFVPGDPNARRAFIERVHRDDRTMVLATRSAVQDEGAEPTCTEWRVVWPDGQVRWVQARVRRVARADRRSVLHGTVQDITDRKAAEAAVVFQASHDTLTGLPNRAFFLSRLKEVIGGGDARAGTAVLFLDLDRFKWINDSLGHAAGDLILVELATRLREVVRPGDTVARLGGDEFVVLCEGVQGRADAEAVAKRISSCLNPPILLAGQEIALTASIGFAYRSEPSTDTAEDLVRDADMAMYEAKEQGRDRIVAFDIAARHAAVTRHETVTALRRSIGHEELVLHYQPEIDITTGAMVGVEALVRWDHPDRGLLAPGEFIGLAEESGLIVPLGAEVLRIACSQLASWQRSNPALETLSLSVNLAARQLLAPDLTDVVEEALAEARLDPHHLYLEITESVLLEDGDASARALRQLKSIGVGIGVDDFGTGFSSLTYLKRFPVDILKIDRSFVAGLGRDREDRAIVASVVDLAHAFGLTTIAEGIETPAQLDELRSLGCEQGQGYLWSRALPASELEEWSNGHNAGARAIALCSALPAVSVRAKSRRCRHRVLLVDDDRNILRLLRLILEGDDDFEIVGETGDGREAVALARHHRPDLVLLDLAMPAMGGLEALPLILAVSPAAKVVVLSGLDGASHARSAERQGASAYVLKGSDLEGLCATLRPILAAQPTVEVAGHR